MSKFRNVYITADEIMNELSTKEYEDAKFLLTMIEDIKPLAGEMKRAFALGMAFERVGVDNSAKPENY